MSSGSVMVQVGALRQSEGPVYLLKAQDRSRIPSEGAYSIPFAWPVFGWRVLVPKLSAIKGDPMQRVILRLSRAGVVRSKEVAELIDADPRLIERLVRSFTGDGLLHEDGTLAAPGKELLIHDDAVFFDDNDAELGWIFRDAITGDVLPYFHRGSIAVDRTEDGLAVLPYSPSLKQAPSAINIGEALRLYRIFVERSLRGEAGTEEVAETSEAESMTLANADVIQRLPQSIRIVSKNPERIALPNWFGVRADDPSEWHISTGFSDADLDYWMEKRFEYAILTQPQVKQLRDRWLNGAKESFPVEPSIESEESRIDREFPFLSIPKLIGVRKALAVARRGEALFVEDTENFDTVLVRYYNAVEGIISAVIRELPNRRHTALFFVAQEEVIREQATRFAQQLKVELPARYLGKTYYLHATKIQRGPSRNALANALFLLFRAATVRERRLQQCFVVEPSILALVQTVYDLRNRYAGHYSSDAPPDKQQVVRESRAAAERIIVVFGEMFQWTGNS